MAQGYDTYSARARSIMGICNSVVVGQPYSTCFDIASSAGVTVGDLTTWNIGLNCNTLHPGQRICISAGTITAANSDGSCQAYRVQAGDSCDAIGLNFGTNAATLETWNKNTDHWKGCSHLDVGLNICVSSGTPPPVPVNPNVQCGPESAGKVTCPLNACCSASGACDTTIDSCTTAAVSMVTSSGKPCTDAKAWAQSRLKTLWTTYIPSASDPNNITSGCWLDNFETWWIDVASMEAAANWMIQSGTTDYNTDLTTSHVSYHGSLFSPASFENGQDDGLWASLLYMIIGDFQQHIGRPKNDYWSAALDILNWVGEDTGHSLPNTGPACDGGVWWKHTNNDHDGYKNTITNALFIQAAAKAYMKGAGSHYLDQAKAAWNYISRMRDPADGLYNDGPIHPGVLCLRDSGSPKWSYNQGTMVSALGALYKATGNKTYIDEALITIDGIVAHMTQNGILVEGCDVSNDVCNHDQVNFKGLCLRHIAYFFDYVDDPNIVSRYSNWLGQQAKGVNANAKDANGKTTSVWYIADSDRSQRTGDSDVQRSALDAMLVAMKYGTC